MELTLIDIIVSILIIVLMGAIIAVIFMNMTPIIFFLAKFANMTKTVADLWGTSYSMSVLSYGIIIIIIGIILILVVVPLFIRRGR